MNIHEAPPAQPSAEFSGDFRETPSVFRIGNPGLSLDLISVPDVGRPQRLFAWQQADGDLDIGQQAGWHDLVRGEKDGYTYLDIPQGTRPARSILGGVEAWEGEKADLLSFLEGYERELLSTRGAVDLSVSLNTVARTSDGQMFITPPHNLSSLPDEVQAWSDSLHNDVLTVIGSGTSQDESIEIFTENIRQLVVDARSSHGIR